jgi:hypothetical protein
MRQSSTPKEMTCVIVQNIKLLHLLIIAQNDAIRSLHVTCIQIKKCYSLFRFITEIQLYICALITFGRVKRILKD